MSSSFNDLMQVRIQLVKQQLSINECISTIDALINSQMGILPNGKEETRNIPSYSEQTKVFPKVVSTKRDKLKHILSENKEPITAREIKSVLLHYGETLPNVDQSLVNLEKDGLIKSLNESGRKRYYIAK